MSDWWTYRLSDLLLFSPRTYYRLIALYNHDVWPLHLVALLAGVIILTLILRRGGAWQGRLIAAFLALAWIWVAYAFHLKRYASINWAATWLAAAFTIEAILLIWAGVVRSRFDTGLINHPAQWFGLGLYLFALLIEPLVGLFIGRPLIEAEVFGIVPDPTAVGTLGILLFLGRRISLILLVLPLLWCAISGATLWTMRSPDALVLPIAGFLGLLLALWRHYPARTH